MSCLVADSVGSAKANTSYGETDSDSSSDNEEDDSVWRSEYGMCLTLSPLLTTLVQS